MANKKKICRAEECSNRIKAWQDLCPAHFSMLPWDLRNDIIHFKKQGSCKLWYEKLEQAVKLIKNKEAAIKKADHYD